MFSPCLCFPSFCVRLNCVHLDFSLWPIWVTIKLGNLTLLLLLLPTCFTLLLSYHIFCIYPLCWVLKQFTGIYWFLLAWGSYISFYYNLPQLHHYSQLSPYVSMVPCTSSTQTPQSKPLTPIKKWQQQTRQSASLLSLSCLLRFWCPGTNPQWHHLQRSNNSPTVHILQTPKLQQHHNFSLPQLCERHLLPVGINF